MSNVSKVFNRDVRLTGKAKLYSNETEVVNAAGTVVAPVSTTTATTSGNTTVGGILLATSTETIAAGGTSTALNLTKFHHDIDADVGGDIFTLANGTVGQMTLIVLKTATGIATITPATFLGGTSITLNAAGDSVMLYYGALGRQIMGGNSYAIV